MASALLTVFTSPKRFVVALSLLSLLTPCFCLRVNRRLDNYDPSTVTSWTSAATASWYGNPYGSGTDGGGCGYQDAVGKAPFNSMVSAGGPSIYKGGRGCGACYQIRCTSNELCSGNPVTVVITDECPGCYDDTAFFDMSGTAFGSLSKSFSSDQFRNLGRIKVDYRRVPCNYAGINLTFRIDSGSNPYYLAVLVEYEAGDGDMTLLEVMPNPGSGWAPMTPSWGVVWKYQGDSSMPGPFSFRITTSSGQILVAENAVPAGWQPGQTYVSAVNFAI
jgi:hypothetical protein